MIQGSSFAVSASNPLINLKIRFLSLNQDKERRIYTRSMHVLTLLKLYDSTKYIVIGVRILCISKIADKNLQTNICITISNCVVVLKIQRVMLFILLVSLGTSLVLSLNCWELE